MVHQRSRAIKNTNLNKFNTPGSQRTSEIERTVERKRRVYWHSKMFEYLGIDETTWPRLTPKNTQTIYCCYIMYLQNFFLKSRARDTDDRLSQNTSNKLNKVCAWAHPRKNVGCSFIILPMCAKDHIIPNPNTRWHSCNMLWNLHGVDEESPNHVTIDLEFDSNTKMWNEDYWKAATIGKPSRMARSFACIAESMFTSFSNWWRIFPSESLNTPLIPSHVTDLPKNKPSSFTLMWPSFGDV